MAELLEDLDDDFESIFNLIRVEDFQNKAKSMLMVFLFSFCCRYMEDLTGDVKILLEHVINEHLGHIEEIRDYYSQ